MPIFLVNERRQAELTEHYLLTHQIPDDLGKEELAQRVDLSARKLRLIILWFNMFNENYGILSKRF